MRGLLVKDWKMILLQKRFLLLILLICILMIKTMGDSGFIVGYTCIMGMFLALGTLSYDEFDNGYAFLFTLPVLRRTYVLEKYLLCVLTGAAMWGIAMGIDFILNGGAGEAMEEKLVISASLLAANLFVAFFMLPIRLKFGAEKSRLVNFVMIFVMFTVIEGVTKYVSRLNFAWNPEWIASFPTWGFIAAAVLVFAVTGVVSILASIKIVNKKQF